MTIRPESVETWTDRSVYRVFIDGIEVTGRALEADANAGYVIMPHTDQCGCPIISRCEDGNYRVEYVRFEGKVQIASG